MRVGKIAHQYLSDYAAKQNVGKTFGIYKNPRDKQYYMYIGNTPIDIRKYNLVVGDKEYEGTPGLWEHYAEIIVRMSMQCSVISPSFCFCSFSCVTSV